MNKIYELKGKTYNNIEVCSSRRVISISELEVLKLIFIVVIIFMLVVAYGARGHLLHILSVAYDNVVLGLPGNLF